MEAVEGSGQPNQTLYVSNLSERLKREELRKMLYALFSTHGPLIEVVALKTNKMRGQAFVIYKDLQSATKARRELNNFPFYGRPMRVDFSKNRSHLVEKMEGTFDEEQAAARKAAREVANPQGKKKSKRDQPSEVEDQQQPDPVEVGKKIKMDAPEEAPYHILFVQNLPAESTELMVQMLFQQFPGFKSVKLVEGQGIAFVEFAAIPNAEVAKNALQHFRVKDNYLMMISFAKQ